MHYFVCKPGLLSWPLPPWPTRFPRCDILEPFFIPSIPLPQMSQLVPKSWCLYFANTPRVWFLFSTHSAGRFIFLSHTCDDIIILLKSFNCLRFHIPLLQRAEPSTGCSPSYSLLRASRPRHWPSGGPLLLWGQIPHCLASGLCLCLSLSPTAFLPLASHLPKPPSFSR